MYGWFRQWWGWRLDRLDDPGLDRMLNDLHYLGREAIEQCINQRHVDEKNGSETAKSAHGGLLFFSELARAPRSLNRGRSHQILPFDFHFISPGVRRQLPRLSVIAFRVLAT
jgi:hypothetical protein